MDNKNRASFMIAMVLRLLPASRVAEVENALNVFESQIRQDQKEKCVIEVNSVEYACETPTGDNAYLMEDIEKAIMEADQ